MVHIAFDLGLTTTGVAWPDGSDTHTCPAALRRSPITPELEQQRLAWWQHTFNMILLPWRDATIVIEAPFIHNRHPSGAMSLIMLHGVLRAVANDGCHPVHQVEPTVLKRWATGNGGATKEQMMRTARQLGWEGVDHNEADAFLLWTMWAGRNQDAA